MGSDPQRSRKTGQGLLMTRFTAIALTAMLAATAAGAQTGAVEIVDGDTVKVGGISWRLQGYDTPEIYYARCNAERQAGELATRELAALIRKAKTVRLVPAGRLDRYQRRLGRLYIDGRDVADIMVQRGLARRYNGRGPRQGSCP
jgi:endonuclease YncB( thermonuclease family)